MKRRTFVVSVAVAGASLAGSKIAFALADAATATPTSESGETTNTTPQTGYAPVNGLEMYYEMHGSGRPLVMLHGGLATIDVPGGLLLQSLAETRLVIAIEQQGHGRTADTDRPLTYEQMADDTAAFLQQLGIQDADVFGFSMGGTTALGLAIRHPDLVRKLVVVSASFSNDGMHPENIAGMQNMTPELLAGSPFEEIYLQIAPNPEDWPTLLSKLGQLSRDFQGWPAEDLQAIEAPTLIMLGDADAVRLEHAVELFRLLGGGVPGDFTSLPDSQFAVLPGTTHFTILTRVDWLQSMIGEFLDAPMPD